MLIMGHGMVMRNHGGCGAVSYANKGAGLVAENSELCWEDGKMLMKSP